MQNISLQNLKHSIEKTLRHFFSGQINITVKRHPLVRELVKSIAEFILRKEAKRVRGILVLLGYLANTRRRLDNNILKVAAAYEALHAYLLVHDDIIDDDEKRHSQLTLNKFYESFAPRALASQARKKIGSDLAVIAGDLTAALASQLVFETKFTPVKKLEALKHLNEVLLPTTVGQAIDILALPQQPPSLKVQYWRYFLKTAIYTIETPFLLGTRMSGARINEKPFKALAYEAGLAFQLADDIKNLFDTKQPARLSDIRGGKITLLISLSIQNVKYRAAILKLLKKKNKSIQDCHQLKRLIINSGGYERACRIAQRKYELAVQHLSSMHLPESVKDCFEELVNKLKIKIDG